MKFAAYLVIGALVIAQPAFAKGTPSVTFLSIEKSMHKMTKVQWENYKKSLYGKQIRWTGYVHEVKQNGDTYTVSVGHVHPDEDYNVNGFDFDVPAAKAMKLNKGQKVTYTGKIVSIQKVFGVLGVMLEDRKLE